MVVYIRKVVDDLRNK